MTLLTPSSSRSSDPAAATAPADARSWRPRSDADLLAAQLRALDEWHLRMASQVAVPGQTRESRLDETRRRDIADREREAMRAWAARSLQDESPFGRGAIPRAVVAHRNEWLREKVGAAFRDRGLEVVASTADGAVAAAAIVMEQPDLVFVEDLLPAISGIELIERTRVYAPDAFIGAHALGQQGMPPLLDAGARAAFSRRIPPGEIAAELVDCLHGRQSILTLV
jgi:CheY-like chemotaxis protein